MKNASYHERYFGGYRYYDPESGFLLNFAGASGFDLDRVLQRDRLKIARALDFVKQIEAGRIVNTSEDRRVDHFNLRKGDGLIKSLRLWRRIRSDMEKICDGRVRTPNAKRYTDVIFNGIGGSFLGPLMTVIARHGADFNLGRGLPLRIHFVNNTDPGSFRMLTEKISLRTSIMVHISKSGGTAETAGNMEAFNALLEKRDLAIGPHNMTVTTPGSPFDGYSRRNRFLKIYHMNVETGGRTSVGSAVGMVPAAFADLDFESFLKGQSCMDGLTRRRAARKNPALILALVIDDVIRREGHKNQILLGYSDSLKEAAHYFQQLFMESLGKKRTRAGRIRREPTGLTILGGVGTGEQHAFMQQVQEGIRDAFVHFVSFRRRGADYANEKAGSMGRQLLAFLEGTQRALLGNGRDFVSLVFERQDEFNMGMLVALEERVVAFLGGIWGINPFDQPGVQAGKLSADNHNRVAKAVHSLILEEEGFRGTADDAAKRLGFPAEESPGIEAILVDIVDNHALADAYPGLKKFSTRKTWRGSAFGFEIKKNE